MTVSLLIMYLIRFNGKVTYVTEERVDVQVLIPQQVAKGSSGLITSEANIGDTVVATYTVPTSGNDIGTVTFNLSQFGGSATTTATKTTVGSNDVYTSDDLVLTAGNIDGIAKASVTVLTLQPIQKQSRTTRLSK